MRKVAAKTRVGKTVKAEWRIIHSIYITGDPLLIDVVVDYLKGTSDEIFVHIARKEYKGKRVSIWSLSSFHTGHVVDDKRFRELIEDVLDDVKGASITFRNAITGVAKEEMLWVPSKLKSPSEEIVHSSLRHMDRDG